VRPAHGRGVVESGGNCHAQPAARDAEVDRLVEPAIAPLRTVLQQHVLAGDTELGRTVLHVGRHVGSAHDHDSHLRILGADDQLAGSFRISSGAMPAAASNGCDSSKILPLESASVIIGSR